VVVTNVILYMYILAVIKLTYYIAKDDNFN